MMLAAPSSVGDAVVVGGRPAARVPDLGDDLVGHRRAGAGTVAGSAEVVDDDAGALPGQGQRVFTAQSPAGSGDDDDAILHSGHSGSSLQLQFRVIGLSGTGQNSRRASLSAFSV